MMQYLPIIAAGIAGWMFGAVWYGMFSTQWMKASKLTLDMVNPNDKTPYLVSFLGAVATAAFTDHMYKLAGISTPQDGLVTGLGLGAFVAAPWTINNILYGMRNRALIYIDGGYAVFGCGAIGLVLCLLS